MVPDTGGRLDGIEVFSWTPREFIDDDLLQFCFTDANDAKNQIPFIRERVQHQLKRFAVNVARAPRRGRAARSSRRRGGAGARRKSPRPGRTDRRGPPRWSTALDVFLEPEDGGEPDPAWTGRVMPSTVSAFMRRLHAAASRLGHLVRSGETRRLHRGAATVTVVAIQSLHEQAQRFVVGALLAETFREKEETGQRLPLSVIVLDELNKYAPREGTGPLKDMLIDIAQRGRSLGVLLVGAQQTASRVASEVLENAAIRVSGRLDAAEAERAEYGWMLPSTRARARLLKPGTMVISQPAIPVPLVVTFPSRRGRRGRRRWTRPPVRSVRRAVASAPSPSMKILHTSDWHIGRRLGRHDRTQEFRAVLDEVIAIADERDVDLVLVSGDVFDRPIPPVEALALGIDALLRLAERRPVVVVAGNHDPRPLRGARTAAADQGRRAPRRFDPASRRRRPARTRGARRRRGGRLLPVPAGGPRRRLHARRR